MKRISTWIMLAGVIGGFSPVASAQGDDHIALSIKGQSAHPGARDNETTRLFRLMGKNAIWKPVASVSMNFQTYHTQGMVKIDQWLYVSAAEVIEATQRDPAVSTDALYDRSIDRTPGKGRGWLFQFTLEGQLIAKTELTDGQRYHPGGIDYDGKHLWVPVAEYRPNSTATIYRVDPRTMVAERAFCENDHIGGVVFNRVTRKVHGVSWGSRRLYTWEIGNRTQQGKSNHSAWVPNPQFNIDYQDCHYQGVQYMLCGGVGGYSSPLGNFAFGGAGAR